MPNDEKESKDDHEHQNTRDYNIDRYEKTILRIFEQNFISSNVKIIIIVASTLISPSRIGNEAEVVSIIG